MNTGGIIHDLVDSVDRTHPRMCVCGYPWGQHSNVNLACPNPVAGADMYLVTKFKEMGRLLPFPAQARMEPDQED